MIRLVTQFDDAETRASAATPTCGGCCCCCCCCIATVISSSAYTAMNLRAHARVLQQETNKAPSFWVELVGALSIVLALALAALAAAVPVLQALALVVVPVAWFLILWGLYRRVSAPNAWLPAFGTILVTAIALVVEFVAGAVLVLSGDGGAEVYLVIALAVIGGAIYIEHRVLLDK